MSERTKEQAFEWPEGVPIVESPTPWQPSRRQKMINEARDALRQSGHTFDPIYNSIMERAQVASINYLLTGSVERFIKNEILPNDLRERALFAPECFTDYSIVLRRFEQEYLGLEPNKSSDGLRIWAGNAGFGYAGELPLATIAAAVGATETVFQRHINRYREFLGQPHPEWTLIRSGMYLFAAQPSKQDREDVVTVSGVRKFSPEGAAVFEGILSAFEIGQQTKSIASWVWEGINKGVRPL